MDRFIKIGPDNIMRGFIGIRGIAKHLILNGNGIVEVAERHWRIVSGLGFQDTKIDRSFGQSRRGASLQSTQLEACIFQ